MEEEELIEEEEILEDDEIEEEEIFEEEEEIVEEAEEKQDQQQQQQQQQDEISPEQEQQSTNRGSDTQQAPLPIKELTVDTKAPSKGDEQLPDDDNMEDVEQHVHLMESIRGMGYSEHTTQTAAVVPPTPTVKKPVSRTPTRKKTEFELATSEDGGLTEEWDPYLPRPPSMRQLVRDRFEGAEQVAVFNANTPEGSTMVRVLSEKGLRVVAAVRVYTSRQTKKLLKLEGVTVKVADWSDENSLLKVAEGCTRAFVVTKFWERFDSPLEEQMATNILRACAQVKPPIKHLVLATFEDTLDLRARNRKSQLVPTRDGRIFPRFDGMYKIDKMAKKWRVQITHMMTSYLDDEEQKKSLILIRGENARIIVQPYFQEIKKTTN